MNSFFSQPFIAGGKSRLETDVWHFPRRDLAIRHLEEINALRGRSLLLSAPRHKGKTAFLLRDLMPMAKEQGYLPIYIDVCTYPGTPYQSFAEVLASIGEKRRSEVLEGWRQRALRRLKIMGEEGPFLRIGLEAGIAHAVQTISRSELATLGKELQRVVAMAEGSRVLLVIDHVHHLMRHARFYPLAMQLRTALHRLQPMPAVVLAASSGSALQALVSDQRAPFREMVEPLVFPDLDRQFVAFLSEVFYHASGRRLNTEQCFEVFRRIDRNPWHLRQIVQSMLVDIDDDVDHAAERYFDLFAASGFYEAQWLGLLTVDRVIFGLICEGWTRGFFSEEGLTKIARRLGEPVTVAKAQNALRRLMRAQHVSSPGRGCYRLENLELAAWYERTGGVVGQI